MNIFCLSIEQAMNHYVIWLIKLDHYFHSCFVQFQIVSLFENLSRLMFRKIKRQWKQLESRSKMRKMVKFFYVISILKAKLRSRTLVLFFIWFQLTLLSAICLFVRLSSYLHIQFEIFVRFLAYNMCIVPGKSSSKTSRLK
mgnify:CR=1 FL=1